MIHRGWWGGKGAVFSDVFIYSFHMPAFFFIAGLFVTSSLAKRGGKRFAIDKLKTILYPYFLFAVLSASMEPLIGRFKLSRSPFHWNIFLRQISEGEASWFLFVLFICLMLALMTAWMPAWLRFLAAVLAGLMPAFGPPFTSQVSREFCFLAAGMWVNTHVCRLERVRLAKAALCFTLLVAFQVAIVYVYGTPVLGRWIYILLGLTGTGGLFLLAEMLDTFRFSDGIAWIGRASLAVFLLSAFAQGATREVLLRVFHTGEFWLQLLLPTFFATLLPTLVWHQQNRWRVGWLFRWPY
jgi:fucose 4-O-acetylase-like acetyltransferase